MATLDEPESGFVQAFPGLIHRVGCDAPGMMAALPLATATGRGPITTIADGKGGELWKCLRCGALENAVAPSSGSGKSKGARAGPPRATSKALVDQMRAELQKHPQSTSGERSIAKALGVSRGAVRYALGKDQRRRGPIRDQTSDH